MRGFFENGQVMPGLCHNAISLPGVENFKKTIQPYIHDRLEKVYKESDNEGNAIYETLPTGIPMIRREIDLDFEVAPESRTSG